MGEWTPQQRRWITRQYHRMRKWAPVYDPTVPLKLENPSTVRRLYEIDPWDRYSLWEGRYRWKLLWGADIVADLPDLSAPERLSAVYTYVKWWWMVVAHTALDAARAAADPYFTGSICAKAAAEFLRIEFLRHGWHPISRDEALSLAASRSEPGSFLRRLNEYVQSGYSAFDGDLVRETVDYLPRRVSSLCSRLTVDLESCVSRPVSIEIDGAPSEHFHTDAESTAVNRLREYLQKEWEDSVQVFETVGMAFVMDEIVLVIRGSKLPGYDRLLAFNRFRDSVGNGLRRNLACFLNVDDTLLQLHPADRNQAWQAILTRAANPETVLPLPFPQAAQAIGWSQAVEDFLRLEITLFEEALDSPAVYKANALDFLRMFWKYLQMVIVARTSAQGRALFPQTVDAVRRGTCRIRAPQSDLLPELASAYFALLAGKSRDLGWMQPAAVEYLKEVRSAA